MSRSQTLRMLVALPLLVGPALTPGCTCEGENVERVEPKADCARSLTFGEAAVGVSLDEDLYLRNAGNGTLTIRSVEVEGPQASAFTVRTLGAEVIPQGVTTLTVVFKPLSEGEQRATVVIRSNAVDNPELRVELTATGVAPALSANPNALDFGELGLGETRTLEVTLTNRTNQPAEATAHIVSEGLRAFTLEGADPDGDVPVRVDGLGSQVLRITYAPNIGGVATAELDVDFCGPGCGISVPLTGALRAPRVDVTPLTLDFGRLEQGQSAEAAITVTNRGSAALDVTAVEIVVAAVAYQVVSGVPATLAPDESREVTLRFTPVTTGRTEGRVKLTSNDPRTPTALVDLVGTTSGSDVVAIPGAVDLGALHDDTPIFRDVLILNRGDQDASLTGITVAGDGFALEGVPPLPLVLGPAASLMLTVRFTPPSLGTFPGTLRVETDVATRPELTVSLSAARTNVACALTTSTEELGFGAVRVGQQSLLTYRIRNAGTGPCTLSMPIPSPTFPNDSAFSFQGSAAVLQPGDESVVTVRFSPRVSGIVKAVAQVGVGEVPPVLVTVRGRGINGEISANPTFVDFGGVPTQCGSRTRSITLLATGEAAADVDAPVVVNSPPFGVVVNNLPAQLTGGQAITFDATFAPDTLGEATGQIRILAHLPDELELVVGLRGEGVDPNAPVTETFDVTTSALLVDVLFVIDNSGSMYDNQQRLAENAQRFINAADFQSSVDFHLGVTTTDVTQEGAHGQMLGSPAYLTRGNNVQAEFPNRARVGVEGSPYEQGLEAARMALSPELLAGTNAGFLRPEAGLAIIIVSDEEDSSPLTVAQYLDFFRGLKAGTNAAVVVSGITGGPTGCMDPNTGDEGYPAPRYQEAVSATGGIAASICAPDWGTTLQMVGESVFLARGRFSLAGNPRAGSITVTVNGTAATTGWTYEPASNSVVFDAQHLPPVGGEVAITYVPVCSP
ncbi:MAG: choice-of-anchor D domain-containing protein [Myxococcota bacterium]